MSQSATALGATWDTKLVEEIGLKLLASEAKLRAASVILAPTCNIQRVRHGTQLIYYSNADGMSAEPTRRPSTWRKLDKTNCTDLLPLQSFESFAEDPYLSGMISASYVNGIQSGGIGTTIKHFVYVAVAFTVFLP